MYISVRQSHKVPPQSHPNMSALRFFICFVHCTCVVFSTICFLIFGGSKKGFPCSADFRGCFFPGPLSCRSGDLVHIFQKSFTSPYKSKCAIAKWKKCSYLQRQYISRARHICSLPINFTQFNVVPIFIKCAYQIIPTVYRHVSTQALTQMQVRTCVPSGVCPQGGTPEGTGGAYRK